MNVSRHFPNQVRILQILGIFLLLVSSVAAIMPVNLQPLSNYRNINIYVANDEGVKYNVPDGISAGFTYNYVPNTYFVLFEQDGGGLNALHITADPTVLYGQITRTTNPSGTFWLTHTGGQKHMDEGILMLAVNGTIPDDFSIHIRSSGYNWTPANPADPSIGNAADPKVFNYVDGALDQTFTKSDFIYGPENWKPCSSADYPIFDGENKTDPNNQFQIMFIDLRAGALQSSSGGSIDNGSIKVEYSFNSQPGFVVFNAYGWYSRSNHGTGVIMTNDVSSSGYTVTGVSAAPVVNFTANTTTGTAPLSVQFTDTSTGSPTAWAWDFGDNSTSTSRNPVHTYANAGTYTVSLTASNSAGSNTMTRTSYITVTTCPVSGKTTIGMYRNGVYYLRNTNTAGDADLTFAYGSTGDIPVTGDWNGDGIDTVGMYRNGVYYLRNTNTAGNADLAFAYGSAGDIPVTGDWNGDGVDTIGMYRNGVYYLRNTNTAGNADLAFAYGSAGDIPVTGDWNGDGVDTIGMYRNGVYYLRNTNTAGNADFVFAYGSTGDIPVTGEWT